MKRERGSALRSDDGGGPTDGSIRFAPLVDFRHERALSGLRWSHGALVTVNLTGTEPLICS